MLRSMRSGKDAHLADDLSVMLLEHVIDENRRVGQDDALHRAVRDVALVPERDVFVRRDALARTTRARPQICSQLTGLRLCGIAELPRCSPPKRLLGFAHFGALQVADLEGNFFERGRR